jgi:hypothetical protein
MFIIKRLSANGAVLACVVVIVVTAVLVNSCNSPLQKNTLADDVKEGKVLSEKYCASCHNYPGPALLNKTIWETAILPTMAAKLGLQTEMGQVYADKKSLINIADWQKIIAFYKAMAPNKLVIPKSDAVTDWAIFKLKRPARNNGTATAMTTMIKFNTFNKLLYTADASNNLYSWDAGLKAKLVKKMASPISSANFFKTAGNKNMGVFTCIGVMPPNDYREGRLEQIDLETKKPLITTFTDSLPRPVQMAAGDFNHDSLTDYLVCGFGNTKGALYLVTQQAGGTFKKRIIRPVPGAIELQTGDFNNDGWLDFMCQFAQADEGLWMFLNDKRGGFTSKKLISFPPVYGTYSFQLVDLNKDGLQDIIYLCGDNNDLSPILKPYHGVYIFTNQGNWKFKQTLFYHINGASKSMAADFDGDGDMDIATIAFFPDFKDNPKEGFTYMEQTEKGKYKAHSIPIHTQGRWLVMETSDIDGDGDPDIILGNFSIYEDKLLNQKDFKPNWDPNQPIIILENTSAKHK